MKKTIFMSILPALLIVLSANMSLAADNTVEKPYNDMMLPAPGVEVVPVPKESPKALKYMGHGPKIDEKHPMKLNMPKYHSPEEVQAKKAEIEKRLNLSEKQRKQIEKNKEKDKAKIIPIIKEIKAKNEQLHKIYKDETLSKEQKHEQAATIKKDLAKLRAKADKCRKDNMKKFESVLDKNQKAEFEKIKLEQKEEMQKRKAEFEKKQHQHKRLQNIDNSVVPEKVLPVNPQK